MHQPVPPTVIPYKLNWTYAVTIVIGARSGLGHSGCNVSSRFELAALPFQLDGLLRFRRLHPSFWARDNHRIPPLADTPQFQDTQMG